MGRVNQCNFNIKAKFFYWFQTSSGYETMIGVKAFDRTAIKGEKRTPVPSSPGSKKILISELIQMLHISRL
jgi:hypothetical protein